MFSYPLIILDVVTGPKVDNSIYFKNSYYRIGHKYQMQITTIINMYLVINARKRVFQSATTTNSKSEYNLVVFSATGSLSTKTLKIISD